MLLVSLCRWLVYDGVYDKYNKRRLTNKLLMDNIICISGLCVVIKMENRGCFVVSGDGRPTPFEWQSP